MRKIAFLFKPESFLIPGILPLFLELIKKMSLNIIIERDILLNREQIEKLYEKEIEAGGEEERDALVRQLTRSKSRVIICDSGVIISDDRIIQIYETIVGTLEGNTGIRSFVEKERIDEFWQSLGLCDIEKYSGDWWRYNAIHSARNLSELRHFFKWIDYCGILAS